MPRAVPFPYPRRLAAVAGDGGVGGPGAPADDFHAFGMVDGDVGGAVLAGEIEIDAAGADAEATDVDPIEPVRKTGLDDVEAVTRGVGHEAENGLKDLEDGAGGPGLGPAGDRIGHRRFAQRARLAPE